MKHVVSMVRNIKSKKKKKKKRRVRSKSMVSWGHPRIEGSNEPSPIDVIYAR